ncbi:MAG: (d)CMP kinase [Desulfitobacteriaceae bacterium]
MGELSLGNKRYLQIAIDGPAGAGKSTVAKAVAQKLGIFYLDTGAMYRAIALKAMENEISINDEEEVSRLAERTELNLEHTEEKRIWCDGLDYTDKIRSPEVSRVVSIIAAYPRVRKRLVFLQRREAELGGVVMDGRDIGSHVLPQADLKIFLTALPKERARRRWLELQAHGQNLTLEEVSFDMEKRDLRDTERAESPLEPGDDALILDTTGLNINEIVAKIVGYALVIIKQGKIT